MVIAKTHIKRVYKGCILQRTHTFLKESNMFTLIWSLLGLSLVPSSFGNGVKHFPHFPSPSTYQFNPPAVPFNQPAVPFNQPAVPFNQPAVSFNQQAVPFNQPAVPFNQPAFQYNQPSVQPVGPSFNAFQPNFQVPSQFQGLQTSPSRLNIRQKFTDVVRNFKDNFVRSVSSHQKYVDAFDLKKVDKETAANIWYDHIRSESIRAGEKDPEFSAFTNAQAVRDNYEYIDSDYHLKVFGFSLGEYLYQKRVLNAGNVQELSERLAQTMKDSIDENANPTNEDNLAAVLSGCERFLTSLSSEDLSWACDAIFAELFYILKNCY